MNENNLRSEEMDNKNQITEPSDVQESNVIRGGRNVSIYEARHKVPASSEINETVEKPKEDERSTSTNNQGKKNNNEGNPEKPKPLKRTGTADYRFMQSILSQNCYAALNATVAFKWNGKHWQKREQHFLNNEAIQWLGDQVTFARAVSCAKTVATSLPSLPKRTNEIIIPCKNHYLKYENGQLSEIEADRKYGFTYSINADAQEKTVDGEKFMEFLNISVPDPEIQALLQEYAGYTLMPDCRFHKAVIFTGPGGNGKSVFIEIMRGLHPQNAAIELDKLDGFKSSEMIDASLLSNDETPKGKINDEIFKALVSGGAMQFNQKNKDLFTFENKAKIIANCNTMPEIRDQSEGFWRRILIVPWDTIISETQKNPMLGQEIIDTELDFVLSWALEGLTRLLKNNGRFTMPSSVQQEIRKHRVELNTVLGWLEDEPVAQTAGHNMLKSDVYDQYLDWIDENHQKAKSPVVFWKQMRTQLKFNFSEKQKTVKSSGGKKKRFVDIGFKHAIAANEELPECFKETNKVVNVQF